MKHFNFTGNTVFSDEELHQITASYEGRTITSEELQEARHKLSQHYIDHGYINSGAVIPDQEVVEDIVTIRIIEGKLTVINIDGNERLRTSYLTERIALGIGPPLKMTELQSRLLLLQQGPLIEQLNAELLPGTYPGEAILGLKLKEARSYFLSLRASNDDPPSTGAEVAELSLGHNNITGWGDSLTINPKLTEGADKFHAKYLFPITASDTTLGLSYEKTDAGIIEDPFDDLDIESDTESLGFAIRHPVYQTPSRELALSISLQRRHNETKLLDLPFSFSPGAEDGESTVSVLRFSQEWLSRSLDQVLAARSVFSVGINAFDATVGSEPDGQFVAWLGQFQWARRFGSRGNQILLRTDIQLTNDSLLSLEQIAVGGAHSVRGYRTNQLVRDNAVVTSLEFRTPLFRQQTGLWNLQGAVFADYGRAWNHDSTPDPKDLFSVGLGVRWDPDIKIHAELYWGKTLRDVDNPDNDLQDRGIHFALHYKILS